MSAVNIFPDEGAVEIWTDAAAYADDGEILGLTQKVVLLEDISAAVAVQGDLRLLAAMEIGLPGSFDSFDDLAAGLGDMAEVMSVELAGAAFLPTIFKAAGYSEARQRLEVWSVAVGKTVHHPEGPAQMLPLEHVSISICSQDLLSRLAKAGLLNDDGLCADTEADRLAVIRAQRETTFPYEAAGGRMIKMIGGWAQRTIVRKGSVTTAIVERWPDEVGPRGRAAMAASGGA